MSLHLGLQLSLILIDSCGLSNDPESDAHSSDSDRTDQDQRTRKVRWFILYPFQQPLRCSSCLHQSPPEYQTFILPSFLLSLPCFSTPSPLFWFYSSFLRSLFPSISPQLMAPNSPACITEKTIKTVQWNTHTRSGQSFRSALCRCTPGREEIAKREENTGTTQCREKIKDREGRVRYWCPCCDGFQSVLSWGWNEQNKTAVVSGVRGILRI